MEELRDQSCISPICEDINAALRIDDATPGDTGDVCVESYSNTVGGAAQLLHRSSGARSECLEDKTTGHCKTFSLVHHMQKKIG